ncbi:hypothetical protein [Rhodoferax ferrireducens]|uniref:hypothetical protein n=1 Tax=Rhodoferax ferrireducens TaxID=192843 RepID=UPI001300B750|nr:hypothetical protein [Rhodoferax ferrireducens]
MGTGLNSAAAVTAPKSIPIAAPMSLPDAGRLLWLCLQLGLVLLVIYQFQLESRTFFNVMALGFAGFVVHALLPLPHRLPFFAGLSLAAIVLAFGPLDGGWLILLGLVLIGICHLPWRLSLRIGLLALTAGLFALWRLQILPGPWSVAIWPILGSMFMFRLAVYLYALKHDETRPTPARTLAYFFMLPNVCFPLFPVVDYSTMRRTYYDREAQAIYETGLKWIVRGLVQLILYRIVYVHLAGDAMELNSLGDLVQFLLATFLLYLRVSGQFHLITGVLHLFGFRLPETHHLYFLAASFTDFWRRINIYWKDFMMKLVYYPSFFRLKRYGPNVALIGATVIVFLGTWLLHSYQWFWLRGGFPLAPQDGLFWGVLGALVVMGALGEMKRARPRKLARDTRWSASLALRTAGTFTAICVLWSLWSAESISAWLLMWSAAAHTSVHELAVLGALLLIGLGIAGKPWPAAENQAAAAPQRIVNLAPTLLLVVILALGWKAWYAPQAPALASAVASVQRSTLNARDAALQHKGYYENLDNSSRLSAQLWDLSTQKPAHWLHLGGTPAFHVRSDFLGGELQPNTSIVFMDQPFSTNALGMRDRPRSLAKPAGVYRIAVLGPSHVMGSGVADADTFTRLLEERLNRAADRSRDGARRYEVLNFGVAAYALTQQLAQLEDRVLKFAPDAVFFVDSPRLAAPTVQHLLQSVAHRREIPSPRLQRLMQDTGVAALGRDGIPVLFDTGRVVMEELGLKTRMPWTEADWRLRRSANRAVRASFEQMADRVRSQGAVPVFVGLDNVAEPPPQPVVALGDAAAAGLLVFDLFDLWQGRDATALRIASWDNHPNRAGNQLVAERLQQLIEQHASALRLTPAATPSNPAVPAAQR